VSYPWKSVTHLTMSGSKPDDARTQAAPPDSIETLFAAQESALLLYARKLVHQAETAEDIVQEAFLKLQADFASVRQPQAWLYRTVHNLAMNQLRAARRVTPLEEAGEKDGRQDEISDQQLPPDEHIQRLEAIGQTRLCLKALDARSRELLRLKFEEGLSYKEISDRTQLTSSNVGYILFHALRDLAGELKKTGVIS